MNGIRPSPFPGSSHSGSGVDDGPPRRRSDRQLTRDNTAESERRAQEAASRPTGQRVTANGRAQDPIPGKPTFDANKDRVDALKKDKAYKDNNSRVHFKGDWFDDTRVTSGTPLAGPHVDRGSWSKEQIGVNRHFGDSLKRRPDFASAPHSGGGTHGAEISHIRAQHAGGRTDLLGAYPASWHSNVEDMAREEGMKKLHERLGGDVRLKSTVYVQETGVHAGTQVASRHKIYIKNDQGVWEKKFDHIQDGRRDNIDKDEANKLKDHISNLSSSSPNVSLHGKNDTKGVPSDSVANTERLLNPSRKNNDSTTAPYFTDTVSSDGERHTSQDARTHMEEVILEGYKNIPA